MGISSSLATLSAFPHYKVQYTRSASTVKDQGVESTPTIRMAHTFSSLTSSFIWKTPRTTWSDTGLWAPHTKVLLTT